MRRKKSYIITVLILICLIVSAFYAPGIAMEFQDARYLQDYEFRYRNGIDYETVELRYLTDKKERLETLAKDMGEGRQYYIVSSGEQQEADKDAILVHIFEAELPYLLQSVGILWYFEGLYNGRNITDWDYYLIYSSDTQNGAVIPCWYVELEIDSEKIRVLADAVDYTVYYIECYNYGIWEKFLGNRTEDGSEWYGLSYDLLSLKDYYGGYSWGMSWSETAAALELYDGKKLKESEKELTYGEYTILSSEIVTDIIYDNGTLQLSAGFLSQEDGMYGIGIGIKEILELLPQERRGTRHQFVG